MVAQVGRGPLCLVLAAAMLLASASADAARKKPRPKGRAAPAVVEQPPEPVPVAPLETQRPDALRIKVEDVPGPGVTACLVVDLHHMPNRHPAPGVARVASMAVLYGGAAAEVLATGGAVRRVRIHGNTVALCADTLRERWKDDVTALLDGASNPMVDDAVLVPAAYRATPFGAPHDMDALFEELFVRAVPPNMALTLTDGTPASTSVDSAVWHFEDAWVSDQMTLVVAGHVPPEEVAAVVDKHFLIPASVPEPLPPWDPPRPLIEDEPGPPPGHVAYGAFAWGIPPEDALVLAQVLWLRITAEVPSAGDCQVRYLPDLDQPVLLSACAAVRGSALDVREVLSRAHDHTAAPPPTPAELAQARTVALGTLAGQRVGAARTANRLCTWAAAGLDGGRNLEQSVAASPDARLLESWQKLLAPERFIRLHRKARSE